MGFDKEYIDQFREMTPEEIETILDQKKSEMQWMAYQLSMGLKR